MIEFLKNRKIFLIVPIIIIGILFWKNYNSNDNFEEIEQNKIVTEENNNEKEIEKMITVHIAGEVKKPGIVNIKEGSRVEDVIKSAGGLTESADITNVNLAHVVEDGIKIRIPSVGENELSYIIEGYGENVLISEQGINTENSLININNATQTELEGLPGIGPSIASRIIEYRTKNGKFKQIEDLKKVTGIGQSKFEKIKDYIKV